MISGPYLKKESLEWLSFVTCPSYCCSIFCIVYLPICFVVFWCILSHFYSFCLSTYLPIYLFVYLSIFLSIYQSIHPFIYLSLSPPLSSSLSFSLKLLCSSVLLFSMTEKREILWISKIISLHIILMNSSKSCCNKVEMREMHALLSFFPTYYSDIITI